MQRSSLVVAVLAGFLGLTVSACSSDSSPSTSSPAPVASPVASPVTTGFDAVGLVAAMWAQLGERSQKQLCDIFASKGVEAGQVFVAGAESDPKANLLTDANKADIAARAGDLLKDKCAPAS